jgi:hypothetical protein
MTTYKEIFGKYVKNYSSDPTADAEGQVWYNTTSGTFKSVVASAAWSASSPLITARSDVAGAGSQTTALAFGGQTPSATGATEEYNGSGWASSGSMGTGRYAISGFGTQTAAVAAGGSPYPGTTAVEEYNGSTWSPATAIPGVRQNAATFGTESDGGIAGGNSGSTILNTTLEYNGSTWTSGGNLGTARYQFIGCGAAQTAALAFGGSTAPGPAGDTGATEEYDGSAWTAGGTLNTARRRLGGSGIQTSALAFGGNTVPVGVRNSVESYNGTSWATAPSLATARTALGPASFISNNNSGLGFGGATPTIVSNTEEYNVSSSIITAAAWASGGAIGTALENSTGFGLQTAAVIFGGEIAPGGFVTTTQNYDGSTWTASGAYPISVAKSGAAGTQTAGLGIAGGNPYGVTTVSEYGGSTWTAGGAYPFSVASIGGVGTQTAALGIAGDTFPPGPTRHSTAVRSYDGSAWTTAPSLAGAGRYANLTTGTQTAAMTAGGSSPGGSKATEVYNGVSWTSSGNLLNDRSFGGASRNGAYTNSLVFGTNGALAITESFDGSIWSTAPNMATARYGAMGAGTGTSALAAGGRAPGFSTATEEFNGETTSANVKTITTS